LGEHIRGPRVNTRNRDVRVGALLVCLLFLFIAGAVTVHRALAEDLPGPLQAPCVPGPHSGVIAADQQWCAADSPHVLTANVTISPGVVVTVTAGVTVQAADDQALYVQGILLASGTEALPITFTSVADSAPGQWGGLAFDGAGGGPAEGQLAHVIIRNAGRRNGLSEAVLGANHKSAITGRQAALTLEHVTVSDVFCDEWWCSGYEYGLIAHNTALTLTHTLFTGIGGGAYAESDVPIALSGALTTLEMSDCELSGNENDRILLVPGAMMGHAEAVLPAGALMDGYEFREDYTVPPTVTLTIEPGVAVLGGIGSWNVPHDFVVEGRLIALGTPTQPITFTSVADSGPGQWNGLAFDGVGGGPAEGQFSYVTVRNAGERNRVSDAILGAHDRAAITARNATLTLDNVTLQDVRTTSWDKGLLLANSQVSIEKSLFTGIGNGEKNDSLSADAPIHVIGASSTMLLGDNQYVDNAPNMIKVAPGALAGQDFTLFYQQGLGGYLFQSDCLVPHGITMTIEAGVTYRGDYEDELRVEGNLVAIGTPTRPITFTSFLDSGPFQWSGLVFEGSAGQGNGDLRHATVRYAGHGNSVLNEYGHGGYSGSNITARNVLTGALYLEDVIIERMYHFDGWHLFNDAGLFLEDSRATLLRVTLRENGDRPEDDAAIHVRGASHLLVRESSIEANSGKGIEVIGDTAFVHVSGARIVNNLAVGVHNEGASTVILSAAEGSANTILANQGFGARQVGVTGQIIATYNWWGDASGPTHAGNPGGIGEPVSDRVLYDPWLQEAPTPPAVALRLVQVAAPQRMSVGQVVNLGVYAENVLTHTLESAIVVLEIPPQSAYLFSSHGGRYWPEPRHVIWNLGDMAPGATFSGVVQVRFQWGIPNGTLMPILGMIAAGNLPNENLTYTAHRDYAARTVLVQEALDDVQLDVVLAADPALGALFQHVLAQGYQFYGNAMLRTFSDASQELELLLLDPARLNEMVAVRRVEDQRYIQHETGQHVRLYDLDGGARFDHATAQWFFWGDRAGGAAGAGVCGAPGVSACPDQDWGDCLRNCLIRNAPRDLMDASRMSGSSCRACQACTGDCQAVCSQCARDMWKADPSSGHSNCTRTCMDSNNWNSQQCDKDNEQCWDAPTNQSKYSTSQYMVAYECDGASCQYEGTPTLYYCRYGCEMGDSATGVDTRCRELDCDGWSAMFDTLCPRARTAHDPNALHGPLVAAPGHTLAYTIETENEGEATAYDVFVEASLSPELDEASLQMGPGGLYFPGSRTMLWLIGELDAGAGAVVTYTVALPGDVVSGTLVMAQAKVHFPSVPELTPTNPVVTLVQDVAAHGQTVAATPGEPLAITLSGSSAGGGELTYVVVTGSQQGTLAGVAPDLVYTPDDKAGGLDGLLFTVSDGVQTSAPAAVNIVIGAGQDASAPRVLAVSPTDGATDVTALPVMLYEDVYPPSVWAQFDEPLDPTTITGAHVALANGSGQPVALSLYYSEGTRRIYLELHEPLRYATTYTVTLGTGLTDLAGNLLAEAVVWSFTTAQAPPEEWFLYLPITRLR